MLYFAWFEREIAGERFRDQIAASEAKRLHVRHLKTEKSIDQHSGFAHAGPILDLSDKEVGDVRTRDYPIAPL